MQAMQAIKQCNAKLKEDIKVQNQATYIERSHVNKQLSCKHGAESALKKQEIVDLQKRLHDLQTKEQIEQQVHEAIQKQFQELQGSFQLIAASWSDQTTSDSTTKIKALEVSSLHAQSIHRCGWLGGPDCLVQELKAKHNVVLGQFKEAQAEHTREVALKQEREQHAREAADVAEQSKLQEQYKNSAAACIQAHWRAYKVRQGAKGGKDKGKKGKKKK
jgi:IQ calmodulin-binding motif